MVTVRWKISPAAVPPGPDAGPAPPATRRGRWPAGPPHSRRRTAPPRASSSRASSSRAMTWGGHGPQEHGAPPPPWGSRPARRSGGPHPAGACPGTMPPAPPARPPGRPAGREVLCSQADEPHQVPQGGWTCPLPAGRGPGRFGSWPASMSRGSTGRATPSRTRGTRMDRELSSRSPSASSPWTDVPHTPTRKPPGAVTYPWLRVPAAGVPRELRGPVQHFFQVLRPHLRLRQGDLPLRERQPHRPPHPQPQLLHPGHPPPWDGQSCRPQGRGAAGRRPPHTAPPRMPPSLPSPSVSFVCSTV